MIPDKLKELRDDLADEPHLTASGRGRMTFQNGFDAACDALLPVMREMIEAIEDIEPKLTDLAKTLREGTQPDERIRIAEHDACLIAIGYLNIKPKLAKAKEVLGEY